MGKIFLSIVALFVVIAGVLVFQATRGTRSLVFMPSELLHDAPSGSLERIRLAGRVIEPISYSMEPKLELRFSVEDPKNPQGSVPVVYQGIKPDMFTAGRDVIIDGDYESGTVQASKLLTQCPSKYEPPVPGAEVKQ